MKGNKMNRNLKGGFRLREDGTFANPHSQDLSRRGFLKGLGAVGAGVAAASVGLGGVAHANGGGSVVVYPTDDRNFEPSAVLPENQFYSRVISVDALEVTTAVYGGTLEQTWNDLDIHVLESNPETGDVTRVSGTLPYPVYFDGLRNPNNPASYTRGDEVHLKTYSDPTVKDTFTPFWFPRDGQALIAVDGTVIGDSYNNRKPQILGGGGDNVGGAIYIVGELGETPTTVHISNIELRDSFKMGIFGWATQYTTIENVDVIGYQNTEYSDNSVWGILFHCGGRVEVRRCYVEGSPDAKYAISNGGIHYSGFPFFFGDFGTLGAPML